MGGDHEDGRKKVRSRRGAPVTEGSDTEDLEHDEKGGFKRQVNDFAVHLKRKGLKYYSQYQSDPEFRQQIMTYAMVAVTLLLVVAYYLNNNGNSSTMSVGNAVYHNKGAKGRSQKVYLTKIQREKAEGLDIEGRKDLLSVKRRYSFDRAEIESAQKKARKPLSAKDQACFRFPATIRRDGPFTYYQPKKVFDLAVLQRSLKKMGWTQEADQKKATLILKGQPRVTFAKLKKGQMYYDMVSNLGRIGSKKKTQLATLRNHVRKFKCSFESLHIQPRSYDMNKPSDCKKFFEHPDTGKMWVLKSCKSGEGSKGAGISVIDNLIKTRNEWGECEANAFNYVAQEYIEHPLLLKGRKFDMRAYLFVANTNPYVVYFNPGYIRRSLAEYKPSSTEKNDVLTNYHIQMNREDFKPEDAMWSFPQFMEYLQEEGMCEACGDVEIQLAKISRLVFDSGREYYKRFPGSFQIVGLDFMMDAYLNVYFIEGNVSPGLGSHKLKWKTKLMDDLVTLMYEQTTLLHERPDEFDMRIGERVFGPYGNYWELVVHEQHEKCNKKEFGFNPCAELKNEGGSFDEPEAAGDDSDETEED